MAINALQKQAKALKNQLHAFEHQYVVAKDAQDALKLTLATVEQQIDRLEEQLNDLSDEEYKRQFKRLKSVKGIGPKIAHLLLTHTGGFQNFDHQDKLAKFIGLVASSHTSGTSVNKKGKMTKRGNGQLRKALYMGARSAKRWNTACTELYERLTRAGKCHRVAMVAVMHKMVNQAFAVVTQDVPFDNEHFKKFKKKDGQ